MRSFAGLLLILCTACTHLPTEDASPDRLDFSCSGSEPFWSLSIDADIATLRTPGDQGTESTDRAGAWSDADLSDGAVLWRGQGARYAITRKQCFSEAGEAFEFETDLAALFPKSPRAPGCCRRTK